MTLLLVRLKKQGDFNQMIENFIIEVNKKLAKKSKKIRKITIRTKIKEQNTPHRKKYIMKILI